MLNFPLVLYTVTSNVPIAELFVISFISESIVVLLILDALCSRPNNWFNLSNVPSSSLKVSNTLVNISFKSSPDNVSLYPV